MRAAAVTVAGLIGSALLGPFLAGVRDTTATNPDWWPVLGAAGSLLMLLAIGGLVPTNWWTYLCRSAVRLPPIALSLVWWRQWKHPSQYVSPSLVHVDLYPDRRSPGNESIEVRLCWRNKLLNPPRSTG